VTPTSLAVSPVSWAARVADDDVLVLDCLGTLLGALIEAEGGIGPAPADEALEATVTAATGRIVEALTSRRGPTIVVSNEVGWGIVPQYPSARLFRDVLGRANRILAGSADRAWLVVAGRCIDLKAYPKTEDIT
jgi:adenosylcobinamide kinase/adenosylcobinamide-phosphate guanylyltransferase